MKKLLILALILIPAYSFSQANAQIETLKMMVGTWRTDVSSFKSTIPGYTQLPDHKVMCKTVTETSLYCEYFMNDGKGKFSLGQSELFAYDQATNKIYNMTFEGPSVQLGYLTFNDNTMTWTGTDVNGNVTRSGTMLLKANEMSIEGKMADGSGTMSFAYKREK